MFCEGSVYFLNAEVFILWQIEGFHQEDSYMVRCYICIGIVVASDGAGITIRNRQFFSGLALHLSYHQWEIYQEPKSFHRADVAVRALWTSESIL